MGLQAATARQLKGLIWSWPGSRTQTDSKDIAWLQVNAEAQRISREADQANAIAAECQAGLDKALPALAAAEEALNVLTKKDMSELKVGTT